MELNSIEMRSNDSPDSVQMAFRLFTESLSAEYNSEVLEQTGWSLESMIQEESPGFEEHDDR